MSEIKESIKLRVGAIIQARMGSTRLPGKVLKKVLGKPLLAYQVERLSSSKNLHAIIVATTDKETDQPIVDFCHQNNISVFRGSETDVLSRFYHAAKFFNLDVIVRVTADCPLIDPEVVDRVVAFYLEHRDRYDYVSNVVERTFPRGLDCEIFEYSKLKEAFDLAQLPYEREHVTPYFYSRAKTASRLGHIRHSVDLSFHRWTVDTPEDFALISKMLEALYPRQSRFNLTDCLQLLESHPEWVQLNAHVAQKDLRAEEKQTNRRALIVEKNGPRAGDCYDYIFSFGDTYAHEYPENYLTPSELNEIYDDVFHNLCKWLDFVELETSFSYRGVNLWRCLKKYVFEQAYFIRSRFEVLKRVFDRQGCCEVSFDRSETVSKYLYLPLRQVLQASNLIPFLTLKDTKPSEEVLTSSSNRRLRIKKLAAHFLRWNSYGSSTSQITIFSDYQKFKAILPELKSQDISVYLESWAPKIILRSLFESFSVYCPKSVSDKKGRDLLSVHNQSQALFQKEGLFSHFEDGQLLWDQLLRQALKPVVDMILPDLLRQIDQIHEYFSCHTNLRSGLLDEDCSPVKNAFCQVARQYEIVTYVESHGALGHQSGFLPLTANYLFAWGNAQKNKLVQWGADPQRILLSGCSRYQHYVELDEQKARRVICSDLKLSPQKKIVLFGFSPRQENQDLFEHETQRILLEALQVVDDFPDVQFVIKFHPGDLNKEIFPNWLREQGFWERVSCVEKYDPLFLARGVDVLVTYVTTYALDGVALGKQVICLNDTRSRILEEFRKHQVFHYSDNQKELRKTLSVLLTSESRNLTMSEQSRRDCLNLGEMSAEKIISQYLIHGAPSKDKSEKTILRKPLTTTNK